MFFYITCFINIKSSAVETAENSFFVPSGLSKTAMEFLSNKKNPSWMNSLNELKQTKVIFKFTHAFTWKIGLLRFVMLSSVFPDKFLEEEKLLVFLAASSDSQHEVISIGEDGLKRFVKPDYEDPDVQFPLSTIPYLLVNQNVVQIILWK